jgi:hypothetical protein
MKSQVSQNQIAKLAMSFVLTACVLTQVSLPAFAQNYSLSAEQDSFLPPEVVPLDPQVAQKLAQSQAAARDMGGMNAGGMATNMNVSGDPMQNGNAGNTTSQQTRQNIMDSMMNQGSFQNEAANQQVPRHGSPRWCHQLWNKRLDNARSRWQLCQHGLRWCPTDSNPLRSSSSPQP